MVGCDRTVSEDKSVKTNPDGTQTTAEKTVTKDANGNTTVTQEKKTTP